MTKAREIAELGQKLTVDASGNLDIAGDITSDGLTVDGNPILNNASPQLMFQTGASHYNWQIAAQESTNAAFEIAVGGQDADASNDTYSPKVTVVQSGKVGINTTAPAAFLEVKSGNNEQFKITGTDTNPTTLMIDYNNGGSSKRVRIKNDDGDLKFATNNGNDRFTITEEGASVFTAKDNLAATNIVTIQSNNATAGYRIGYNRIEQISTATPIILHTGGSESMRLDSNNRLGLKTSAMGSFNQVGGANLFVLGSGAGNQGMTIYSGNTGVGSIAFADGTTTSQQYEGLIQYNHSSNSMAIYSNHAERIRINSAGLVGLGTDSPDVELHVSSPSADFKVESTTANNSARLMLKTTDDEWRIGTSASVSNGGLWFYDANAAAYHMTILNNGNVGIGATSPSEKLHIYSNNVGNLYPMVQNTTAGNAGWRMKNSQGDWVMIANDALRFYDHGQSQERARITSTGHLLVGTTNAAPWSDNSDDYGVAIRAGGYIGISSNSSSSLDLNRQNSNGNHINLYRDGVKRANIGVIDTDILFLASSDGLGLKFNSDASRIDMCSASGSSLDAAADIGGGSSRIRDIYLSGGAYINGTASGNKLDDYEEGTWNVLEKNGQATLTVNRAHYTKIGNMVYAAASIGVGTTTNANHLNFTLPFTSTINGYYLGGGNVSYHTLASGQSDNLRPNIENAADNVMFFYNANDTVTCAQASGRRIDFFVIYHTHA